MLTRDVLVSAIRDVHDELMRSGEKHGLFHSAHEGSSVIREEFEELWDHVKADTGYTEDAYKEACQLAAMGVKFMLMIRVRQSIETGGLVVPQQTGIIVP